MMKTTTIIMVILTPFISFGIGYQQGRKAELSRQIELMEAETVEILEKIATLMEGE